MNIKYTALDKELNTIKGVLEVTSESEAMRTLINQGLTPLDFQTPKSKVKKQLFNKKITDTELLLILEQLYVMLKSGLSLHIAVQSLSNAVGNEVIAEQFKKISEQLGKGKSLSSSLDDSQLNLPPYFTSLIQAGEMSGQIVDALKDGIKQFKYEQDVKNELIGALIYPIILIISGTVGIGIIFVFVVPNFSNLLGKVDDLPTLSVIVLNIGVFFNAHSQKILVLLLSVTFFIYILVKYWSLKKRLINQISKLSLFKSFFIEIELARWSYLLGTLLSNQVPILNAVKLANSSVQIKWMNARLSQALVSIREGNTVTESIKGVQFFPPISLDLLQVGEKTGKLPNMLDALGSMLSNNNQRKIKFALQLLEPIAILSLGSIIGLIMAGIILAITSINSAV